MNAYSNLAPLPDMEYADGMDVQYADEGEQGLESLPPEIIEMILASAGPFATARAAQTSRYMAETARQLAQIETEETIRELCPDYLTCLQEFMLAVADDDVPTVEYILASGVIGPRQTLVGGDVQLPRAPSGHDQVDAFSPLRTVPPTDEGWTPLTVAAAYGSPAIIALLASIGVRPRTTVEALINGLIIRARQLRSWGPLARGVQAVTESYPRTVPLASSDDNPLTTLRHGAVERVVSSGGAHLRQESADNAADEMFEADMLPIIMALMRAGYDPGERAFAPDHAQGRAGSELSEATRALDDERQVIDRQTAQRETPLFWNFFRITGRAPMLEDIIDTYNKRDAMD